MVGTWCNIKDCRLKSLLGYCPAISVLLATDAELVYRCKQWTSAIAANTTARL